MDLNKLLQILQSVSPQVGAALAIIQIVTEGIQHIKDTGDTTIPADLETKLWDALARRVSVNDEFQQILDS